MDPLRDGEAFMFALSRDGTVLLLCDPGSGLAVPVLVGLDTGRLSVEVPSLIALEDDHVVMDTLEDAVAAAGPSREARIRQAALFSLDCSSVFADEIRRPGTTVSGLRALVEAHPDLGPRLLRGV